MIDALLAVVLLVGLATLAVAIGALRSSRRRLEELGENRYELLRDQQ
jgi:type II secretory pathway pseudopilin PulG